MLRDQDSIRLDIDGISDERLPPAHRLDKADLDAIAERMKGVVGTVNAERSLGEHRYRDLPYDQRMVADVLAAVKKHQFRTENLVVLGIGGSGLGNIALQSALNPPHYNMLERSARRGPRLFVMDNVDPAAFVAMLDLVKPNLERTLFNVISKSGETAETAAQFLIVRDLLRRILGDDAPSRILVTTDPRHGTMRQIVDQEGYEALAVPDGVGGRFTALSAVGLFSAAMCGIDIEELLAGAADMDERIKSESLPDNPAALLAAIHYLYYGRGKLMSVMFSYSNGLYGLADWYRQMWAESLGKRWSLSERKEVSIGPTPIKALGTTDQHSQVQLYREGPNDKVITFLEIESHNPDVPVPRDFPDVPALSYLGGSTLGKLLNAEKKATEQALIASGRPCLTVRFPRVRPYTVGQFLYLYECATTFAGRLFDVNPYDQPGVELGKKITFHLMGRKGYETMPAE